MSSELKRDELIYMAKICEQSERFADMLNYMKQVLEMSDKLSVEDRNLLSVAYKNSVGTKRTSWRILDTLRKKEQTKEQTPETIRHLELVTVKKNQVETELEAICKEIITTLDTKLIPTTDKDHNSQVFYLKMKGDYYRYRSEYLPDEQKGEIGTLANDAYLAAQKIATEKMDTTDPIRLGLALNFSVFYYEIEESPQKACDLAKSAFDDAIVDIENIPEEHYKDATTIMQLMRDNLTLWTSELENEENDNNGDESN